MDKNTKIAVLMGGPGSEREVSLVSGKSVADALRQGGFTQVTDVDVKGEDIILPEGTQLAFNVIHGTFGEDGQLQALLEQRGMPYTGAGAQSSQLAFDKVKTKKVFIQQSVPTPRSEILNCSNGMRLPTFPLPFVVKPACEGSSVGVHIVTQGKDILPSIQDAMKYGKEVLIEEYIKGKELTVGILEGVALPVIHISPRSGFYDLNNKYPWMSQQGGTDYYCPADLSDEVTQRVQKAALAAYQALGIEVYGRVDVLLSDGDEQPYVLEINTIPGMTPSSLLPKAAKAVGWSFEGLCEKIAELSMATLRGNH
ncbi:MAG: D-alanine--D-alanine ligase [Akkermansia sp.]